jgi:hypothetical protein
MHPIDTNHTQWCRIGGVAFEQLDRDRQSG